MNKATNNMYKYTIAIIINGSKSLNQTNKFKNNLDMCQQWERRKGNWNNTLTILNYSHYVVIYLCFVTRTSIRDPGWAGNVHQHRQYHQPDVWGELLPWASSVRTLATQQKGNKNVHNTAKLYSVVNFGSFLAFAKWTSIDFHQQDRLNGSQSTVESR